MGNSPPELRPFLDVGQYGLPGRAQAVATETRTHPSRFPFNSTIPQGGISPGALLGPDSGSIMRELEFLGVEFQ